MRGTHSDAFVTSNCRKFASEIDFERHCEHSNDVEWLYKNGDEGFNYLSRDTGQFSEIVLSRRMKSLDK